MVTRLVTAGKCYADLHLSHYKVVALRAGSFQLVFLVLVSVDDMFKNQSRILLEQVLCSEMAFEEDSLYSQHTRVFCLSKAAERKSQECTVQGKK